jgi:hypothetical protein
LILNSFADDYESKLPSYNPAVNSEFGGFLLLVQKDYLKIETDFIFLFPEVILTDKRGKSAGDYGSSVIVFSESSYTLPVIFF